MTSLPVHPLRQKYSYNQSRFENELTFRVGQRIASHESPDKSMLNALHYYDLTNSGQTDFRLFQQFVQKFGIQVYSLQELEGIFQSYDLEGVGAVNHKVLVARILGRPEPSSSGQVTDTRFEARPMGKSVQQSPPKGQISQEHVSRALEVLMYRLRSRGLTSILELTAELVASSRSEDPLVAPSDLEYVLKTLKLDLTAQQVEALTFGFESRGQVDFGLLLADLTADFSSMRMSFVRQTFDRLDYKESGSVDIRMLKELFNPRNHPDVKTGREAIDKVRSDFNGAIDAFVDSQRGSSQANMSQFITFWRSVSPLVEVESHFEQILKHCFRFNELPRVNKLQRPSETSDLHSTPIYDKQRSHPSQSMKYTLYPGADSQVGDEYIFSIFDHLKRQLAKRGPKGFMLLYRTFKCNDFDHDGRLSCKEFMKSLHEMRVELLEKETINVFKVFDPKNGGFLSISEFMSSFIPELNEFRAPAVQDLLDNLCEPGQDSVEYIRIKAAFHARGHPDFMSGLRADYQIKEEFFRILDMFLGLTGGSSGPISRDLMLQFFEIMSFAYDNDKFFLMIIEGMFRFKRLSFQPSQSYAQSTRSRSERRNPPFGVDPSQPQNGELNQAQSQVSQQEDQPAGQRSQARSGYRDSQSRQQSVRSSQRQAPFAQDAAPSPDPSPMQSPVQDMGGSFEKREAPTHVNNFIAQEPEPQQETQGIEGMPQNEGGTQSPPEAIEDLVEVFRREIRKTPRGLYGLERLFVLADEERARVVSFSQFADALAEYNVDVSEQEVNEMFDQLAGTSERINYLTLLSEIRGQMNEAREGTVTALFRRMDSGAAQEISTDDLMDKFRPENSPIVASGEQTADQIFDGFADKFELFGRLGGYDFGNRQIRYDEFLEFFDGLSMMEGSDQRFVDFVQRCFV